jgi:hypothetical protein
MSWTRSSRLVKTGSRFGAVLLELVAGDVCARQRFGVGGVSASVLAGLALRCWPAGWRGTFGREVASAAARKDVARSGLRACARFGASGKGAAVTWREDADFGLGRESVSGALLAHNGSALRCDAVFVGRGVEGVVQTS